MDHSLKTRQNMLEEPSTGIQLNQKFPIQHYSLKTQFEIKNDYFKAKVYGPDYSSFPVKLTVKSTRRLEERQPLESESSASTFKLSGQRSGGIISLPMFSLIDHYGQTFGIDNSSLLVFTIERTQPATVEDDEGGSYTISPSIEGVSSVAAREGVFNNLALALTALPGSEQIISITTTGIPVEKLDETQKEATLKSFQINVRKCVAGESFTSTGK